jgi:hypothetical protein
MIIPKDTESPGKNENLECAAADVRKNQPDADVIMEATKPAILPSIVFLGLTLLK